MNARWFLILFCVGTVVIHAQEEKPLTQKEEARIMMGKVGGIFFAMFNAIAECKKYDYGEGDPEKAIQSVAAVVHSVVECVQAGSRAPALKIDDKKLHNALRAYFQSAEGKAQLEQWDRWLESVTMEEDL